MVPWQSGLQTGAPGSGRGAPSLGASRERPGNGKLRGWRRASGRGGWWQAESAGKADSQPLGAARKLPPSTPSLGAASSGPNPAVRR